MKMSDAFPSKWLKVENLNNQPMLSTIGTCAMETYQDGSSAPAITLQGSEKMFGLNKTNANTLVTLFGDDSDAWAGKQIEFYPATTNFQSKIVPCIRLRAPQQQAQQQQEQPPQQQAGDPGPGSEADYGGGEVPF